MATRSYADAVEKLNSLQSNAATLEALRATGGRMNDLALPEMIEFLERIGYTTADLNRLNVVHVTGTKGKGSTCAFVDSIIRHTKPDWKVGLYTSPHLVAVRERIRINGVPISEEEFAKYFYDVWDRLEQNDKVDATILEVGVGGMYDSTNIVPKPVVTGISALGYDHVNVLGKTLKEIGYQKGGIYKPGVAALTVEQPKEGLESLRLRASEREASEFLIVPPVPGLSEIRLGLSGAHQYHNAALAVHLSRKFFEAKEGTKASETLTPTEIKALESTRWPGRCQTVIDPKYPQTTWFLDGAHTTESLDCCIRWFVSPHVALRHPKSSHPPRVLIFNCTSGRSGPTFLGSMLARAAEQLKLHHSDENALELFDHVIFCTNVTYSSGHFKGDLDSRSIPANELKELKTQHELADAWHSLVPDFPKENIHVLPSVEHAIHVVRSQPEPVDVLVAGSLHLVGGVIEVAGLSDVAL
ncbi:hypothetical protein NM688_g494 [Phlebia brevispora]|uniref:Uncharacterized protein n=1 Tax=Phlebia brevispora TaxID=194682 RepID=A0ACC1TDV9_9APHY|nr:hypothetical protein NM688_g494 [Phlebia brevispora]